MAATDTALEGAVPAAGEAAPAPQVAAKPGSALAENLTTKGKNSYYYWNDGRTASEWTDEMAWDGKPEPRRISGPGAQLPAGPAASTSQHHSLFAAAATGAADGCCGGAGGAASAGAPAASAAAPQPERVSIVKYAWADEAKKVKVYVDLPGVGAVHSADADAVTLESTRDTLALRVDGLGGKNYGLKLELSEEVSGSKLRVKPNKLVITLTKAGEFPWSSLRKS
eukprot:g7328.t1